MHRILLIPAANRYRGVGTLTNAYVMDRIFSIRRKCKDLLRTIKSFWDFVYRFPLCLKFFQCLIDALPCVSIRSCGEIIRLIFGWEYRKLISNAVTSLDFNILYSSYSYNLFIFMKITYIHQFSYALSSWKRIIQNPESMEILTGQPDMHIFYRISR